MARVWRKFHGIHFLYWAAVCAVCASVNVSYSRENASIQRESAPTQTSHYRHSWLFQCMFAFFVFVFFFFSSYMLLVRGCGVQKEGGLSQLTVFDKLAQPVLTGFRRRSACMHACMCVCVCMSSLYVGGAGLIGGQKKVYSWFTPYNKREHLEYIQLEAAAKSLTCSMCSLPALPCASAQTCVIIYVNLYVGEANTCVYLPVFVSSTHTLPKSRRSN